ncbi:endonuclease/exonuclease/phosphatase family protein [Moheibacter lacus]|uniref:Endonuclease/exonuclease/phosphatase family protein n=1 Tax=Moheibacter lacus TaxID=2745851 RepID=A0A838ZGN9_9FLAO|nr:endonuclease/exonuclease/phosphatase family protein [Moheibacter lacus]MBA5628438.1 endonuclease/exonuclease/phosphatase family protein [Moheibacter lacus]
MAIDLIFYFSSFLWISLSLIPLIQSPKWYIRIWDYPRFQFFCISILILLYAGIFVKFDQPMKWIILGLLIANTSYLFWFIYPYSFFSKKMLNSEQEKNPKHSIKFLTINVYQKNTAFQKVLTRIQEVQADVVFLLETDEKWKHEMQSLKSNFPYFIEVPKENTYGLLFYSKFPIQNKQVNYLIDKEIPSIVADLELGEKRIRIFGIHPTPPVPIENQESTERDAELLIVGKKAKEFDGPSIVFGDLNDVAWSHTTRLFLRISEMLDPRIGRGMFNTFHAKYPLMRWPLDHFFVSSHFRLIDLKIEKEVNSDHFPISIHLSVKFEDKEKELDATQSDHKEANKIISEAK